MAWTTDFGTEVLEEPGWSAARLLEARRRLAALVHPSPLDERGCADAQRIAGALYNGLNDLSACIDPDDKPTATYEKLRTETQRSYRRLVDSLESA